MFQRFVNECIRYDDSLFVLLCDVILHDRIDFRLIIGAHKELSSSFWPQRFPIKRSIKKERLIGEKKLAWGPLV